MRSFIIVLLLLSNIFAAKIFPEFGRCGTRSTSYETVEHEREIRREMMSFSEDEFIPSDTDEAPAFIKDTMTKIELIECFRNVLITKYHDILVASIYLTQKFECKYLEMGLILHGMANSYSHEIYDELLGMWGYYLMLQPDPDEEAKSLILAINNHKLYIDIFDGLLSICKSLQILSGYSKQTIKAELVKMNPNAQLKAVSLQYLYGLTEEEMERKLKKFGGRGFNLYESEFSILLFDRLMKKDLTKMK